ncbi:carbohydrate ABC transporter permease [Lentzea sp. NPDC006480]|uniref:carbohydrate ABC transporter permease n=1 Tax=Lentzea sp. NPDC006480 TaxID=3157176 RepID=UPI0033BA9B26
MGLPHATISRPTRAGSRWWVYFALVAVVLVSLYPLYWSIVVSTADSTAVARGTPMLIPGENLWDNVVSVFEKVEFGAALRNSFVVGAVVAFANVVLSSLAGFAFARLRFRGRGPLFLVVLSTTMVPAQLGVVPLFMLVVALGWYGDLRSVIVPGLMNAFSVFWMRQACEESVPQELVDAARVDGCSLWRVYWHVALPGLRPQLGVLAMLSFMVSWNDFFWPLIVLDPQNSPTVQVVVSQLAGGYFTDYSLMITGATLGVLPMIALFAVLARRLVNGIMSGAPRGR